MKAGDFKVAPGTILRLMLLLAGLMTMQASGAVTTEVLPDDHDDWGVFWVQTEADDATMEKPAVAEFNQHVTLHIKDLKAWWQRKKDEHLIDDSVTLDAFINQLVLLIDSVPFKTLPPDAVASYTPSFPYHAVYDPHAADARQQTDDIWNRWDKENKSRDATGQGVGRYHLLTYTLLRKDDDLAGWTQVLRPHKGWPEARRRYRISVGFERKDGGYQEMVSWVRKAATRNPDRPRDMFFLVSMPNRMIYLFGTIFLLSLVVLWWAGRSGMLRDPSSLPRPDGMSPFSLARCQIAFWLLLIILSFVFLWQMLGRRDTINNTAVILLGISSFTAVGSTLIPSAGAKISVQKDDLRLRRRKLQQEMKENAAQQALRAKVETDEAKGQLAALQDQYSQSEAELKKINEALAYGGPIGLYGFVRDLLTDPDKNLSIGRFQMLVWTLVLGAVFAVEVYWNLIMPEFNSAVLSLLGITSGTYLGFKGAAARGVNTGAAAG